MSVARIVCCAFAAALPMIASAQVQVYAAGSLRAPLTAMAAEFEKRSGQAVQLTFGASGLLRDRIASGEPADVFASANMEHPDALSASGWAAGVVPFARNELCVLAQSRVPLDSASVLARMLDPEWKVGTSTPKADPSGDYAWEVFHRAEALRPGAFAILSGKARQLTGGPQSQSPARPADRNVYALLVTSGEADLFLTYCTNAQQAIAEAPSLVSVRLPDNLRVGATYGLAVRRDGSSAGRAFADYLTSPQGQRTLARFGFAPP